MLVASTITSRERKRKPFPPPLVHRVLLSHAPVLLPLYSELNSKHHPLLAKRGRGGDVGPIAMCDVFSKIRDDSGVVIVPSEELV